MELDVYIPSISCGIEVNGPFHYYPIFGREQLLNQQRCDQRRRELCFNAKIFLIELKISRPLNLTLLLNRAILMIEIFRAQRQFSRETFFGYPSGMRQTC
jgi:hypothetical protein